MTELLDLETLPVPAPVRRGRSRGSRLRLSIASGVAGALGFAGTAVLSDARHDDGEQATTTNTASPEPVLVPSGEGTELARAGSTYGVEVWSSDTRAEVLGMWGALSSAVGEPAAGGAPPAATGVALEDPRLGDPATPAFADPCARRARASVAGGRDDGADEVACAVDSEPLGATILGDRRLPPNAVALYAYPPPSIRSAAGCRFTDLADGEVPLAVVTANPGDVVVSIGDQEAGASSSATERGEWDEWMQRPVGVRPPGSYVAHCLTVALPAGRGPFTVRAVATDDGDQEVVARTSLAPLVSGLPPVSVTAVDGTMVRVDVPLPAGDDQAGVMAVPLSALAGVADCQRVTPEVAGSVGGWRRGTTAVVAGVAGEVTDGLAGRPWLEAAPRLQHVTVPLAEGEPNLLCVGVGSGAAARRVTLLVTPPDARRLALAVTELQLQSAPPGGAVEVVAAFPELGWTPCGARLAASGAGVVAPGLAGVLCSSGGDTGAIGGAGGAGGVLEVRIRAGGTAVHTARIMVSAVPGGPAIESYRLPIPTPELEGILCTVGADQPSCRPPDAANTEGSLVLSAHWDEGPVGDADWHIAAPA